MSTPLKDRIFRWLACITGKFYVEDYIRVYPNEEVYDRLGKRVSATIEHQNNYLNHCKFYRFATQFVQENSSILDAGCGAGYGTEILKLAGAAHIDAFDLSDHALDFARHHFADHARFQKCGITNLTSYKTDAFDLATCSEVLEHIKEYGKEERALEELKRVLKPDGLLILGTPNDEMLPNHGFSFLEIDSLFANTFSKHLVIENALLPFGPQRQIWEKRRDKNQTGLCVQQDINLNETVLPPNTSPQLKNGQPSDSIEFANRQLDTTLLHNTHSWIVIAQP